MAPGALGRTRMVMHGGGLGPGQANMVGHEPEPYPEEVLREPSEEKENHDIHQDQTPNSFSRMLLRQFLEFQCWRRSEDDTKT